MHIYFISFLTIDSINTNAIIHLMRIQAQAKQIVINKSTPLRFGINDNKSNIVIVLLHYFDENSKKKECFGLINLNFCCFTIFVQLRDEQKYNHIQNFCHSHFKKMILIAHNNLFCVVRQWIIILTLSHSAINMKR